MTYILFLLLGGFIGILSGFFGIGGGIVLTPLLLTIGFAPSVAIGTSLMLTLGSTSSSTYHHYRHHNVVWKDGIIIGLIGMLSSISAGQLVVRFEENAAIELVISIAYVCLLSWFAYGFLRKNKKEKGEPKAKYHFVTLTGIGLLAGFVSSFMGVSGGFVMTPLLINFLGFDLKKAVGTSISAAFLIVSAGIIQYGLNTDLNYWYGLLLIIGAFCGTPIGTSALQVFPSEKTKFYLGTFYLCIVASVILDQLGLSVISTIVILTSAALFVGICLYQLASVRKKNQVDTGTPE